MKIPNKVRFINKKFTNHLMMKIAGKEHSPIALIEHIGRQGGRVYRIPFMAAPHKEGFMFALTYGTGVDWYKNIQASHTAKLTYKEFLANYVTRRLLIPGRGRMPLPSLKTRYFVPSASGISSL